MEPYRRTCRRDTLYSEIRSILYRIITYVTDSKDVRRKTTSYMNEMRKNDLYTKISNAGGIDVDTVKDVFRLAEIIVLNHLSSVTPDRDAKVYLMDGLSISSKMIENYKTKDVRNNEKITIPKKIKLLPKVTQRYKDKINTLV